MPSTTQQTTTIRQVNISVTKQNNSCSVMLFCVVREVGEERRRRAVSRSE